MLHTARMEKSLAAADACRKAGVEFLYFFSVSFLVGGGRCGGVDNEIKRLILKEPMSPLTSLTYWKGRWERKKGGHSGSSVLVVSIAVSLSAASAWALFC